MSFYCCRLDIAIALGTKNSFFFYNFLVVFYLNYPKSSMILIFSDSFYFMIHFSKTLNHKNTKWHSGISMWCSSNHFTDTFDLSFWPTMSTYYSFKNIFFNRCLQENYVQTFCVHVFNRISTNFYTTLLQKEKPKQKYHKHNSHCVNRWKWLFIPKRQWKQFWYHFK